MKLKLSAARCGMTTDKDLFIACASDKRITMSINKEYRSERAALKAIKKAVYQYMPGMEVET